MVIRETSKSDVVGVHSLDLLFLNQDIRSSHRSRPIIHNEKIHFSEILATCFLAYEDLQLRVFCLDKVPSTIRVII